MVVIVSLWFCVSFLLKVRNTFVIVLSFVELCIVFVFKVSIVFLWYLWNVLQLYKKKTTTSVYWILLLFLIRATSFLWVVCRFLVAACCLSPVLCSLLPVLCCSFQAQHSVPQNAGPRTVGGGATPLGVLNKDLYIYIYIYNIYIYMYIYIYIVFYCFLLFF